LKTGIAAVGFFALAMTIFILTLIGYVDLANRQESLGLTANAEAWRRHAAEEIVIVAIAAARIVWRSKSWVRRAAILGGLHLDSQCC